MSFIFTIQCFLNSTVTRPRIIFLGILANEILAGEENVSLLALITQIVFL